MDWRKFTRPAAVVFLSMVALAVLAGILLQDREGWTRKEKEIILRSDSLMYVTVLPQDSLFLRTPSLDLTPSMLRSKTLRILIDKMLYTVQDPSQDGVGIAAPQVGIGRRIVCVQRFDRPGEPFVCCLNPHIDMLLGETVRGPEGCLSVPGMRGIVPRREALVLSYIDSETLEPQRDTVRGFTAVIFQHECDHLDGILYIDRADSLWRVND